MLKVPVARLKELYDPFETDIWGCGQITADMIDSCITRGILEPTSHQVRDITHAEGHAARVAFLAVNGWDDPVQVDVGVPEMCCHVDEVVTDGNHRFAAAIFRGDEYIVAEVSGSNGYMLEVLGVCYTDEPETAMNNFKKYGEEYGMKNDPSFQAMFA